ncbi:MAG: disulfide bond formation protein B [Alphaproteobacteria bacterium]|nr:disulfide bond formation protein B [Alphaproteobacteria bacterium]
MRSALAWIAPDPPRYTGLMAFIMAVAALALAYIAEYGFGLRPCEMCFWQRIPFAVVILLALLAWFVPKMARPLVWLCAATFFVGAGLGAFHAGVEWQWWEGPSSCSSGINPNMTAAEILKQIQQAASVSCVEPAIRVLGLSMAGWNALYSFACAVIVALALTQKPKVSHDVSPAAR